MYYKIENKNSKVYKALFKLRTKEIEITQANRKAVEEKVALHFEKYFGNSGQQNWWRTTQYHGFAFTEPEKVDPKVWQPSKTHEGVYVPNKRTKQGRDIAKFLNSGLKNSNVMDVFSILGFNDVRNFTFPFVEICGETIIVFLGDNQEPKDKNLIEITKKEFEKIAKK